MKVMIFKEHFNMNNIRQKIKLDNSESDFIIFREEENKEEQKSDPEKYSNEWNQEYELIYSSYVLER